MSLRLKLTEIVQCISFWVQPKPQNHVCAFTCKRSGPIHPQLATLNTHYEGSCRRETAHVLLSLQDSVPASTEDADTAHGQAAGLAPRLSRGSSGGLQSRGSGLRGMQTEGQTVFAAMVKLRKVREQSPWFQYHWLMGVS